MILKTEKADMISRSTLLADYLDQDGLVDYNALKNDPWLQTTIQDIEETDIAKLGQTEEFTFWLNAYNIITLKAVSKELAKNPSWNGNTSLWQRVKFFFLKRHKIAQKNISLYNLENRILRKKFNDPRIHFAINCASKSCPFIPEKLFEASTLDETLDERTQLFVNDPKNVQFDATNNTLYLNEIFKWYKKDFDAASGVKKFIRRYLTQPIDEQLFKEARIEYLKYDWSLNSQKNLLYVSI